MLTILIDKESGVPEELGATLESASALKDSALRADVSLYGAADRDRLLELIQSAKGSYVCFLSAGDTLGVEDPDALSRVLASGRYGVIGLRYLYAQKPKPKYHPTGEVSLEKDPRFVPLWLYNHIFRADVLYSAASSSRFALLHSAYRYLEGDPVIYYCNEAAHTATEVVEDSPTHPGVLQKEWYMDFAREMLSSEAAERKGTGKKLPSFLQYALIAQTWFRFEPNLNNSNKHVIDSEYPEFVAALGGCLRYMDDGALFGMTAPVEELTEEEREILKKRGEGRHPRYTIPLHFFVSLMELKHGDGYRVTYKLKEEELETGVIEDIWAYANGVFFQKVSRLKCNLDLMDYDEGEDYLILEYHIDDFIDLSKFDLLACLSGTPLETEETCRYSLTKYFGKGAQKAKTYRTRVPMSLLKKRGSVSLSLSYGGRAVALAISATAYLARVSSRLKNSYWRFGCYASTLSRDKRGIGLKRTSCAFFLEARFALSNFRPKALPILGFGLRGLYWLTRPFFRKKTIWLTYDKLYKGGDCGEYFYKHCCEREGETGITPAYAINGDCPDYKRLKKEGYRPLRYKSPRHYLYYLNSSVVFTTHGGVFNFNGLGKRTIPYVQGLLRHDVACIQHGLTVQQLAHNSNRVFNNMKRYYCASKYEVENLSHPIYGYEDKSALRLTGIPRFDGLISRDKRQILITPTWRNYIALPAAAKNKAKPYFEGFKETDYFKIYNALLSDGRLIETARRCGYRLIYLLHPVISAQIDDYPKREGVEIVPSLTVNYEKILTESSLMVTDYSGVQFDFAYMRKPIVYYHPPKLPPHYAEGGFFYDTMGFGEICTEHDEIVETLCGYMEGGCEVKPFYRAREDDFFAFDDQGSCRRIYDDMLSYQREKAARQHC